MSSKSCGLGFSCAAMMEQPGLKPEGCLNRSMCAIVTRHYKPEDEFELFRVEDGEEKSLKVTRHSAAIMMLMSRANPQSLETMGLAEILSRIKNKISKAEELLGNYENTFIASTGSQMHPYLVKRKYQTYTYYKMSSREQDFAPGDVNPKNIRELHSGKKDDPRTIEAALGISRRNALSQAMTQLKNADNAISTALALLSEQI